MNDFEKCLNFVLVDTFNSILKYEENSLKTIASIPITVSEAHMIEAIANNGESTNISDIAQIMNITMPTATVAVKKLEKKGLITKEPCSVDGRRFIVSLTDFGKSVDRAHGLFHRRMVRNISRGFNEEEQQTLLTILEKLSIYFREKVGTQ